MKWGYQKEPDILCEYGEDQSDDHLLQCTLGPTRMHDRRLSFSQRKSNINCHSVAKTKHLNTYFIFYIHILTHLFLDNFMYLFINVILYSPSTGHDKKKSGSLIIFNNILNTT